MSEHEQRGPIQDILTTTIQDQQGVNVSVPLMNPVELLKSALSDLEVFANLQVPSFSDKLGPVIASRNALTHPCFGPVQFTFPHLNHRVHSNHFVRPPYRALDYHITLHLH